jgi:hypothetical protein
MSIKWGKAEKPKDEIHDDLGGFEEESEDESDIDMDEEETPDLYRNSALGMGMPRDEDDEDEEDMMQFGGDDVIDEMMVGLLFRSPLTIRTRTRTLSRRRRTRTWTTTWWMRMIGQMKTMRETRMTETGL